MSVPDTSWSPAVGDVVRVKDSDRLGKVVRLKGTYDRRFRLSMLPITGRPTPRDLWYGLDEIEQPQ